MSRLGQHIIEQEENGNLEFNEATGQYQFKIEPTTECSYCLKLTAEPLEDSSGDPICLDCHTSRRDLYKDALDDMFGNPMEKLEGLGVRP